MKSLYAARRRRNAIMMTLAVGATLFGLGWLALLITVHKVLVRLRDDVRPGPAPISLSRRD